MPIVSPLNQGSRLIAMASSKYVVRNLWNMAPVLTTNLVNAGLANSTFNATLTKAAVSAFDEYTSIRHGQPISSLSTVGEKETVSKTTGTRRRRRTTSTRQDSAIESSIGRSKGPLIPAAFNSVDGNTMTLTDNDFFFEHQKTRGYRLASHAIANCECSELLQEEYLVDAVAYYLDAVCDAKHLADLLLSGTGEFSIDMWAAVQRGKVKKFLLTLLTFTLVLRTP
jgi:hypothetical protein